MDVVECAVCSEDFCRVARTGKRVCYPCRFWEKVDRGDTTTCWLPKPPRKRKYWTFRDSRGASVFAHRWIYEAVIGTIPDGMEILHRCANGHLGCVNPAHLSVGTHKDNGRDMAATGRNRGVNHGNARLDDSTVREIRRLYKNPYTQKQLADAFQISPGAVSMIVNRRRWSHVE